MALAGAVDLTEVLEAHADDAIAQALALGARVAEHVVPFYEEQAAIDEARLAELRQIVFGAPAPASAPTPPDRVTYAQLRIAAQFDPVAFRAFWMIMGMLSQPAQIYADPHIVAATHRTLRQHGGGLQMAQPRRADLLAALAASQTIPIA
jgi:hypothetical protein